MTAYLTQAFIYLCAAVIAVPLAKRLGLGSVLGYLIAGVIIGPVIGLVGSETESLQHFAEFGVVMMLFLVGLELEPRMLWSMRHRLLGLGGLQVLITVGAILLIMLFLGRDWRLGLVVGMILALSSTAIVLQTLNEKDLDKTEGGRSAFSVLLFQDIAVIPMLALIPLLELPGLREGVGSAIEHGLQEGGHHGSKMLDNLPNGLYTLVVIGAVVSVVLIGHFLSRPLFHYVAQSRLREVFTATSLMLVIGIAVLMDMVGLSPALGTFLAGVVLANSEFRHELESNIEPFKGLLLGLFFMTVGAGINFSVLSENAQLLIGLTIGIIVLKAAVLYVLAIVFKIRDKNRWLLTLSLAQAGEFGFVLLSFAVQNYTITNELGQLLALVVALSMFLTPILFILFEKVLVPKYQHKNVHGEADTISEMGNVMIAGAGRFGQIVNRLLLANGVKTTVLDNDAAAIKRLHRIGVDGYYGDPTNTMLLETAGIDEASLIVICIDGREQSRQLAKHIKHSYPNIPILARAYDELHMYRLKAAGADHVIKETYYSALETGSEALKELGFHPFLANNMKEKYTRKEQANSDRLYQMWADVDGDEAQLEEFRKLFVELEEEIMESMREDRFDEESKGERGWTPPPKDYIKALEESAKGEKS